MNSGREDPENLFIVGGDVETLTETFDWERLSDLFLGNCLFDGGCRDKIQHDNALRFMLLLHGSPVFLWRALQLSSEEHWKEEQ